jgi:hypothetical protein
MTFVYRISVYAGTEFLWSMDFEREIDSRNFYSLVLSAIGIHRATWEIVKTQEGGKK